jgi:SAM-dependent methyltransferase
MKGERLLRLARLARRLSYPQIVTSVKKENLTYLDYSALLALYRLARAAPKGEAAIIECGCALGGSSLVMAQAKPTRTPMHIYDTFGLIPPPTSPNDGADCHERWQRIEAREASGIAGDTYYGYRKDLKKEIVNRFADKGISPERRRVNFIQGLFEETLNITFPVYLAHIDCDWYDSTMICLQRIAPSLIPGGRLVIDDYHAWSGCRKAVDDYFRGREGFSLQMHSRLHVVKGNADPTSSQIDN